MRAAGIGGPLGKTTLNSPPHKPGFKFREDLDTTVDEDGNTAEREKVDPASVKQHMMY